jgi:serine/arginine repetitive matrix protein 2
MQSFPLTSNRPDNAIVNPGAEPLSSMTDKNYFQPRHGQQPAASGPAATAAAQAFLASRPSSTNLSSAAAAAALRSMSPPPTQVSQVQTRRMLQRQSSNSSTGGRPGLERQNSTGSMTERTFRSPSPSHPGSQTTSERAPPVPPVPRNYASSPTVNSERRAVSMEPPPRAMSPTLRNPAGRGAISMDSRRVAHPPQKTIAQRNSNLADINELDRTDSRGSTNFSYPLTARPNSPPPKSSALMQSRWAPGQPLDGISPAEAEAARQGVYNSSQQPVKKKRKKAARGAAEGSHLSSGTTGFRTIVAPQETRSPLTSSEEVQETAPVKRNKKKAVSHPGGPDVDGRPISPGFSSDSDTTPEKAAKRAQRASGILQKQPSVVREDWEGEQGDNMQSAPTTNQRGPTMSLAESPASTVKSTKPSTAANMSRKIDEVAIEPKTLARNAPSLAVDVPIPTVDMPISSTPQSTAMGYLDVGKSMSQGSRQTSLSPSRSKTRFSAKLSSDLATERKHEPLPRSVSPAKSAMKHHSPSAQEASPIEGMVPEAWRRTSITPSEASDNTSMASDQGLTPLPKKKKSAQVSFREGAEIVGVSQTAATESPILASPQHKDAAKKGWFGLGKSKSTLGTIPAEDDMEEVMKPRPMLPSFGSVRGKNRSSDVPEQRTPSTTLHGSITLPRSTNGYNNNTLMLSSSEASTASFAATDTSASSDHAIGSIIAQESTQNRLPNGIHDKSLRQPLPPVVTSVEGTGYASDTSESIYSEEDMTQHVVEEKPEVINPIVSATNASTASSVPETIKAVESVPTIAVQPATPAIEQTGQKEQTEQDDMYVSLPGGFPVSAETLQSTSQGPSTRQHSSEATPAGLGIAEPLAREQVISQQPASPAGTPLSDTLRKRDKEDSDEESTAGDSIYSDAEEDLSYMDGDGFGSINAIVESPIVKPLANRITTPPESPIAQSPPFRTTKPATGSGTESWEQAQAHWSGVAERRRQDKDQPTDMARQPESSQPRDSRLESEHSQSPKPKTKKKKKYLNTSTAEIAPEVLASMEARQTSTQQTAPYPAASSGRGAPAGRGTAPTRTSMRTSTKAEPGVEEPPRFRRSMRSGPSPAAASEPRIPVEASPGTSKPKGALQKKHIPSTARGLTATEAADVGAYEKQRITKTTKFQQAIQGPAAPAQTSRPSKPARLQRTFSNDSDSSSSFRKRRKGIAGSDGKYTMRRSMRDGQSEVKQTAQPMPPQAAGRKGIRSLSPINRRPFSSAGGQPTMRTSMRTSFDASPRTLRNQEGHQRSSSAFAGFGKSKQKSAAGPPSKLKSRFADSDDEDASSPKIFHSRFEDSSDEEPEPVKFRPVRGIPRKIDEDDSTDLEDSSDVEKQLGKSKAAAAAVNTSAENGAIKGGDAPLSPTKEKKSFFGRFRSKKDKEQYPKMSKAALENSVQTQAYLGQARTEIERAKSPEPSIPKSPSSPAPGVQRRLTPHRVMSDQYTPQRTPTESWPLPSKIESGDGDQPYTADGVANASPPAIAGNEYKLGTPQRHNTASTVRTTGGTPVYSEKTGKKKRFPMLRKVFGLYD